MNALDHTYAVILAGGGGTRLWPKSMEKNPKQFLKLHGNSTMLQVTAKRFAKIVPWKKIIIVTFTEYVDIVKQQLPKIKPENVIAEPCKKDTAMAMLVAALFAKAKDKDAILINDAADHVVRNEPEFIRLMKIAAEIAADKKYLVSVGITPTYPSTSFGYIKTGQQIKKIDDKTNVFAVDNFTEKPDREKAKKFIATGKYFWNANNYVWAAEALKIAFRKYMPKIYEQTQHLDQVSTSDFIDELPKIYPEIKKISIDYAISEKADNLVLIPGNFGWDDIGLWEVVYDLGNKDKNQNVTVNDPNMALAIDARSNLFHTNGRLIAVVGVDDLIIVDTDNVLMIAPKSRSQEVKKLVNRLKKEGREKYL